MLTKYFHVKRIPKLVLSFSYISDESIAIVGGPYCNLPTTFFHEFLGTLLANPSVLFSVEVVLEACPKMGLAHHMFSQKM